MKTAIQTSPFRKKKRKPAKPIRFSQALKEGLLDVSCVIRKKSEDE